MIEGYIGRPGSGKSLSMTTRAYLDRFSYDEIFTNYGIRMAGPKLKVVRYNDPKKLMDKLTALLDNRDGKRRLLLLDEVHLILDARMWTKVPAEFLRILAQPRKAALDMMYTAQHESQVEKRLRTVTSYLWHCSAVLPPAILYTRNDPRRNNPKPLFFRAEKYDQFEFRSKGAEVLEKRVYRFKKRYGDLYDTMEVLDRQSLDGIGTKVSDQVAP